MAELDNLLEAARKDYSEKQKEFELRWQLCEEKNELLQKFVSSFESYYDVGKCNAQQNTCFLNIKGVEINSFL